MTDKYRFIENLNRRSPATDEAIAAIERTIGKHLPLDYVEFLKVTDGGEGFIGRTYCILWSVAELASMNQNYEVEDYAPALLVFGSNGGGEALGFDTRNPQWPVVQIPFVGMDWGMAQPIAASFTGFLERLFTIDGMCEALPLRNLDLLNCRGKEIFEITPVILGGSPTDPTNKVPLDREEHAQAVVYWNRVIKELRENR
ncbi:MAG: SMI1/KNR4 family protein [Pirellulales bacterium]|nr:SMI1/KNR4 family protein [Pirellulales bacterium]